MLFGVGSGCRSSFQLLLLLNMTGQSAVPVHTVMRCCFSLFMWLQQFGPTLGPTLCNSPTGGSPENHTMDGQYA